MKPLRLLDLFSGIGGFSYAAEVLVGGFQTVGFCDIEPFARKAIARHWPGVPVHEDVRTLVGKLGEVDVITAGFPCQDLSAAGKGLGFAGDRSVLFYEVIRLAREFRPRFLLLENVRGLLSHGNGETFQEVLFQIAHAGFDAEWSVIPASDLGACHRRERVWIVAYSDHQRSQGRQPAGVCQHSAQWVAWPGNTPGGRLSPDWRSYVSEPVLCRGDDGLSGRVDRLKALGNSIVPQVAAVPLQRIIDIYTTTSGLNDDYI